MLASQYGIANLKRIMPNLIEWSQVDGLPFDDLGGDLVGGASR